MLMYFFFSKLEYLHQLIVLMNSLLFNCIYSRHSPHTLNLM
uniref:Uncharacterized protein n=1 Tax=Lepeophtheirus salmonis TaxID=72036 RepID=A0A0K2VHJ3_LEPSM